MRRFWAACGLLLLCFLLALGSSLWACSVLDQVESLLLCAQDALADGNAAAAAEPLGKAAQTLQRTGGGLLFCAPRTPLALLQGQVAGLVPQIGGGSEELAASLWQALNQLRLLRRLLLAAL